MDLYQSLVTVNPVTLIAQICNLFIQLLIVKIFFLDKIKAVLDKRRETADKQIADAEAAKSEAAAIKQTYEENMRQAKTKADDMILSAQKTAAQRRSRPPRSRPRPRPTSRWKRKKPSTRPRMKFPSWLWPSPERSWPVS